MDVSLHYMSLAESDVRLMMPRTRYNPISVSEFNATVHSTLFNSPGALAMSDEPNIMLSQRLSVMFMVLAIGSLMDTRLPSYSIEAEKYHQLARAALFQNNIFDEPTLGAVQALYLMSFYLFFSDRHGTSGGSRWAIMGMAVKVAQSVSRFIENDGCAG
jgi:Fungal specific transcription factor domain